MSGESSLTNSYIQVTPTQAEGTPAALLNQPVALLGSGLFLCHMGGPLRGIERGRNYNVFFMLRKGLESQHAFAFEALDMPGYFLTITQDDTPELQRFNGTLNHAVACTFDIDNVVTDGQDLLCELYPRKHNRLLALHIRPNGLIAFGKPDTQQATQHHRIRITPVTNVRGAIQVT